VILRRIRPGTQPWKRGGGELPDVKSVVEAVRNEGDPAVARFARRFGDPPPRRIPAAECAAAYRSLAPPLAEALQAAGARIERFARLQRAALRDTVAHVDGVVAGHRFTPIARAGIYVPAGRHPLPSSLLMCAIPARVAGVPSIAMSTPRAAPATLAAAHVACVDECFEIGGPQAIAAMAYGTQSVSAVDLVAGPGNAYVTAAKRAVYGDCGIDLLAGPSEIAIVASQDADPALLAADLLAQAEHDDLAKTMLVVENTALAAAVFRELDSQLAGLDTADVARASLERNGCYAIAALDRGLAAWMDRIAPEHLALHGRNAEALGPELRCYGTLFSGSAAAEVFGDYGIGPNHVLPTGSTARFTGGLSVLTFLCARTFVRGDSIAPATVDQTATLARAEGLSAHRAAAVRRGEKRAAFP